MEVSFFAWNSESGMLNAKRQTPNAQRQMYGNYRRR